MNAPLKAIPSAGNLQAAMGAIGREARAAARQLALAPGRPKEPGACRHGKIHPRLTRRDPGCQR